MIRVWLIGLVGVVGAAVVWMIGALWRWRTAAIMLTALTATVILIAVAVDGRDLDGSSRQTSTSATGLMQPVVVRPMVPAEMTITAWGETDAFAIADSGEQIDVQMVFAQITIKAGDDDLNRPPLWLVTTDIGGREIGANEHIVAAASNTPQTRWLGSGDAHLSVDGHLVPLGGDCSAVPAHQQCSMIAVWAVASPGPVAGMLQRLVAAPSATVDDVVIAADWPGAAVQVDPCAAVIARWCGP